MSNDLAAQICGMTVGVDDLAAVERCRPLDVFDRFDEGLADEDAAAVINYLRDFAKPPATEAGNLLSSGPTCLKCGKAQAGFLGSFRWGLVHGEGSCSCGWPARAYHRIMGLDADPEPLIAFVRILQYHPSVVEEAV